MKIPKSSISIISQITLSYTQQTQNYWEIEGKRKTSSRGIEPATKCSTSKARFGAALASSDSSGLVLLASGALVQWLSGRIAQGPWGGRLFHSLACTRPTTWAKFIQTIVPHSLGYSTVPAQKSLILIGEELDTNQLAAFQGNANLTCSFISLLIFDYH